jgi:hypothetical protein
MCPSSLFLVLKNQGPEISRGVEALGSEDVLAREGEF